MIDSDQHSTVTRDDSFFPAKNLIPTQNKTALEKIVSSVDLTEKWEAEFRKRTE